MDIPQKLEDDLCKPFPLDQTAFPKLVATMEVLGPSVRVKSQKRYSAFYFRSSPFVYIDPQVNGIKLGYFRDHIAHYLAIHEAEFCEFPRWNTSRGGLVGYELTGFDDTIRKHLAIAGMLLLRSFQIVSGWPV